MAGRQLYNHTVHLIAIVILRAVLFNCVIGTSLICFTETFQSLVP